MTAAAAPAAEETSLGFCIVLENANGLAGVRWETLRGRAVQYDLPVDGPHDTFREARPLTAFPEAEAVAPAGTCAAVAEIDERMH